jgi:hypothetical protein
VSGSASSSLFAFALIIASTTHCKRELTERERARALELAAQAQRAAQQSVAAPMPVDPPLEKVRVPNSGLPCDVDDVLAKKCRRCHTTPARHNAPFELYTWDDTRRDRLGHPLYVHIGRVVETGYMPLPIPAIPPVERLTAEEKRILVDWVDAGAPRAPCEPGDAGSSKAPGAEGSSASRRKARPTRP